MRSQTAKFITFLIVLVGAAACAGIPANLQVAALPEGVAFPSPTVTPLIPSVDLIPATLTPTVTSTAFYQNTSTPFPTAEQNIPFQSPANYGPEREDYPFNVNPLTGLVVGDANILNRRPMAIKITNFPRETRPQTGLTQADIVYEYYLEFGLTRFIGVFYGNDVEKIGPVRSGRFFDEHVVRMYDALFAFKSADSRVLNYFQDTEFADRLFYIYCPPLCLDGNKPGYNNVFTSTDDLVDAAVLRGVDNRWFDQSGMRFNSILPWGGTIGLDIYTRYSGFSYNYWSYNPATQRYDRYQETSDERDGGEYYELLIDDLNGQTVAADNVVVIFVPHEYFLKDEGVEIVEIHLFGVGPAWVFRNGRAYEVMWARTSPDGPLTILRTGAATGEFPLKPGSTFIQIIGASSGFEQPTTGEYRFRHSIP